MNALIRIFTNPRAVFDEQWEDPRWVAPALVILAFTAISDVAVTFVFNSEDVVRARAEQIIAGTERFAPPLATPDEIRAQTEHRIAVSGYPWLEAGRAVVGAVLIFFVLTSVQALYFMIVGKVMKTECDFSDWFVLSAWGRMPWVIAAIVTTIAAFVVGAPFDASEYNLLAFSTWMNLENEHHVFIISQPVKSLDLMVIWSIVILTIGFNSWTDKSMGVSLAVVAVPYVIIYWFLLRF